MLGNLAAFMLCGVNVTANMFSRLSEEFHPVNWHGSYEQVLPYVRKAFEETLADLATAIDVDVRDQLLPVIRELCNPDLSKRGHPRGIGSSQQYTLIRYTSQLTNLCGRYELERRIKRKAG